VRQLGREGLQAAAIHGRLSQSRRERTLAGFIDGSTPVLVATNVAARGLHVDGIDLVLHYDMPEDSKTYLHRSGRTARAGETGLVVTLVLPEERRDGAALEREAGLDFAIVPMSPGDSRLLDLAAWDAPLGLPEGGTALRFTAGRKRAGAGVEARVGEGRSSDRQAKRRRPSGPPSSRRPAPQRSAR
jgi:superfamily II DNA/RNA helicase